MNGYRGVGTTLRSHAPKYLEELAVTAAGTAAAYVPALVFLAPFLDVVGEYLVLAVVGWSVYVAQERVSSRRSRQSEASLVAGDVYGWQYAAIALSVGFYHVSVLTIASLGGVYVAGTLQHPVVGLLVAMAYPVVDVTLGRVDWRLSPSTLLSGTFLYVLFHRDMLEEFPSAELYVERTLPEHLFMIPETDRWFRGFAMLLSTELLGVAFAVAVGVVVVVFGVPEPVLVFLAGMGLAAFVYSVQVVRLTSGNETDHGHGLLNGALEGLIAPVLGGRRSSTVGHASALKLVLLVSYVSTLLFVSVIFLSGMVLAPPGGTLPDKLVALSEIGLMVFAVGTPFAGVAIWVQLIQLSDDS